jgi:hypothetical protein
VEIDGLLEAGPGYEESAEGGVEEGLVADG